MSARAWWSAAAGLSALGALAACGTSGNDPGIAMIPEMFVSVPYDAHDPNGVLPHGQTLQHAPPGVVARGFAPTHYGPGPEEALAAGRELRNPIAPSAAEVRRGARVFANTCVPCHGPRGAGDGSVVPPFPNPPSLTANHAKQLPDGQVFHIITHGQGIMPAHGAQVPPDDRWRLVLFVRWLQDPARPVVRAPEPAAAEPTPTEPAAAEPAAVEPTPAEPAPTEPAPAAEAGGAR